MRYRSHFAISLLLVLTIAGLAWYTYPILQRHDASLRDLPSLRERVSALGDRFTAWTSQQGAYHKTLRRESAEIGRDLRARIETTEAKFEQVGAQISQKLEGVNTRVATLESSEQGDQKQIATLQQDLGQMREQVQEQAGELAQVRGHVQDVEKVPFQAEKGRTSDLADGISLYLSDTDPNYRRADGWLWVTSDGRNIWLRDLAAQEPLTFYGVQDGQKRELVITNVTASGVTGYLLLPKEPDAASQAEAGGQ